MRKTVLLITTMLIILFAFTGCGLIDFVYNDIYYEEEYYDPEMYDDYSYEDFYYDDGRNYGTGSTALSGNTKTGERSIYSSTDEVTVMLYLNGSDLEEEYRSATDDIMEIIDAEIDENVNVVIQTGGTQKWYVEGIDVEGQRFVVRDKKLYKIDSDFGVPDMTEADTLSDFIEFCRENYPADRNILVLWDHGCGPVEGFGYDTVAENSDALTLDELQTALKKGGVYFDFIGFDACVMAGIETAAALCDHADYMIFSQDYEGVMGWEYSEWLETLSKDTSISTIELAKIIIDEFKQDSEEENISGILSIADMYEVKELFAAWEQVLNNNYELIAKERPETKYNISDRAPRKGYFDDLLSGFEYSEALSDFSLVDAAQVASLAGGEDGEALLTAIDNTIVYSAATAEDADMCGINVVLPFDNEFCYSVMEVVYKNAGFSEQYLKLMEYMV